MQEQGGATFREYLEVLRRWKWLVVIAAIVTPLVALELSRRQPALYEASAIVLINRQDLAMELQGVTDNTAFDPARVLATQAGLARTPTVARRALAAVGLKRDASSLLGASSVSVDSSADFLTFSVQDHQPPLATLLATAYARQFTIFTNQFGNSPAAAALRSVTARIERLRDGGLTLTPLYRNLLTTQNQLRTIEAAQTSRAALIRPAGGAGKIAPTPRRAAMIGIALGIILGLAGAFLADALDTRVRKEETVREVLGLPMLGRLPPAAPARAWRVPGLRALHRFLAKRRPPQIIMLDAPSAIEAEAVRVLAANVDVAATKARLRTLMVTSAVTGEGKTTTVANLAIALARQGRRVTLIDFDLHAPMIKEVFGLETSIGVSDIAFEGVPFERASSPIAIFRDVGPRDEDLLRPRPMSDEMAAENGHEVVAANGHRQLRGRLDIIPAGTSAAPDAVPPEVMQAIVAQAREHSDVVLVDSPPILISGTAVALAAEVDAIIAVCRLNVLRRKALNELERTLESCPAKKLGAVLTGVDARPPYGNGRSYPQRPQPSVRSDIRDRVAQ